LGLVVDALFGSVGEVVSLELQRCDDVAVSDAVAVIAGSCSRVDESAFVVYRLVLAVEVAVMAFLEGRLPFLAIPDIVAQTLDALAWEPAEDLSVLMASDAEARRYANNRIH
jgi:1-deoxy-D-xylulose 5-phosphate reductoisomerase